MKKIEDFGVMESFGMDEITVDDMFNVDGACRGNIYCNCDSSGSNYTVYKC
ncbi:hypothetical protein SAMN04487977_10610 [Treponema bryantii]|uniref:Lantibiotic n=1 Tax=Treponema bryantii TaxID=163 RepID=A0A1H9H1T0_9SPIR|nr:hypothetical protein [Treponema bryantii]SEQ56223.1 hypothetical protein SAMN04487977_10610 [Treponema bryantii]